MAGIRPIVVRECLRGLASKLALKEVEHLLHTLQPAQIAIGCKGPVIQAAILCVKPWLGEMVGDELLLKVDIANVYNTISRRACMDGVKKHCPDIARWAHWCLNGGSRVYYNEHVILCTTGVQQGDPLAPALFALGVHAVLEQLSDNPAIRQIWFLADGILRGKGPHVREALSIMSSGLARINLRFNVQKCQLYLPANASITTDCGNIPVVQDRDSWSYLDSPLCEQTARALDAARKRIQQATTKIKSLAATHPKQAFHLLPATAGAC